MGMTKAVAIGGRRLVLFSILVSAYAGLAVGAETIQAPCRGSCESIPPDSQVLHRFGKYAEESLPEGNLRVITWNLFKGRKPGFKKEFARLTRDADLILLSEVTLDREVQPSLLALNGFGWEMAASFLLKGGIATGVAMGARARPEDVRFTRTTDLEPVVNTPKAIVLGRYPLPRSGKALLALSIHGINWAGDGALRRQLRTVLGDLRRHDGPVIFSGDFNIKNPERLKIAVEELRAAGLERVRWENPEKPYQLDDAFVRGLEVHRARYRYEVVGSGSDHPAMELEISESGE
ncbi:MAG: endonuclease/exonuclease/phosphatase family protein [Oligoflexia bacterium]|nr:endonuclease/exonuclease/phosphatase family protein [Oligoflexia bacterium]